MLNGAGTYGYPGSSNGSQSFPPAQFGTHNGQPLPHNGNNGQYAGGLALPTTHENVNVKAEPDEPIRPRGGAVSATSLTKPAPRVKEMHVDGQGSSPSDTKPEPNAAGLLPGDEVIDSDLDDDEGDLDDEDDGGDDADVDYVFCVYDKVGTHESQVGLIDVADPQVQRVKNKWKTVFKDGMIHINGKDYLFQKCNGYAVLSYVRDLC